MSAEKSILSETKDELILGIPMIARLRPVVVQPDPVRIAIEVEHVRIAIGAGIV